MARMDEIVLSPPGMFLQCCEQLNSRVSIMKVCLLRYFKYTFHLYQEERKLIIEKIEEFQNIQLEVLKVIEGMYV